MTRRGLVLDLRVSGVSLGFASSVQDEADDALLLDDGTGRTRLPLASPSLWSESNDDDDDVEHLGCVPLDTRVALMTALLAREEIGRATNNVEPEVIAAMKSLLAGLKEYAESRLEKELHELVVLVPSGCSETYRDCLKSSGNRVGFEATRTNKRSITAMIAYKIDKLYTCDNIGHVVAVDVDAQGVTLTAVSVEEGIYEQLETSRVDMDLSVDDSSLEGSLKEVLERAHVSTDQVTGVVLLGELSKFQTDDLAARLEDLLPQATIYGSIPPTEVALCGAVDMVRGWLEPAPPSTLWCMQPVLMTIGIETVGGLMAPLATRNTLVPFAKTARLRVCCESEATTSVELRFFEGERVYARDSTPLGSLAENGLTVGWNEISVKVDVSYELQITIDATLVGAESPSLRLEVLSPAAQMTGEQFMAYFDGVETLPTRAEEENARDQVEIELCTEELVRTVNLLRGRSIVPGIQRAGQVLQIMHSVMGPCVSGFESPASNLLDDINLNDGNAFRSGVLHDDLLDLLDGQLAWNSYASRRCLRCGAYEQQRRLRVAAERELVRPVDVIRLPDS